MSRTIDMIEPASVIGDEIIVASCSDGTLMGYDYRGNKKWETTLSGLGNQVINCIDIDKNGSDEVVAVSNNGSVYCLGSNGKIEWVYSQQDMPLTSLCTVEIEGSPYIVCCGENQELHYLSAAGKRIGAISILLENNKPLASSNLKSIKLATGKEVIALLKEETTTENKDTYVHLFQPLAKEPYKSIALPKNAPIASATVSYNNSRKPALLLGTYSSHQQVAITKIDIESGDITTLEMPLTTLNKEMLADVSDVKCAEMQKEELMLLLESKLFLSGNDGYEELNNNQQYTDLFFNPKNNRVVLTSTTVSGESFIDIVNLNKRAWKKRLAAHDRSLR